MSERYGLWDNLREDAENRRYAEQLVAAVERLKATREAHRLIEE
jgi:hypothetical protein